MTYDKSTISFQLLPNDIRFNDISTKVFARLTVLGYAGKIKAEHLWFCECICGNVVKIRKSNLISNHTQSCGCYRRETLCANPFIHGEYRGNKKGSAEISAYNSAKHRCNNPKTLLFTKKISILRI
jgi:hypothetical protein